MIRSRNTTLDVIRALAASEVILSHLRGFIFTDFGQLMHANILVKAFYFITGFGHQAVVIFFVLSGYLVGGSIIATQSDGFWPRYLVQRLSRLWIVLLPCLLATAIWNLIGQHTGGAEYFSGSMNPPMGSAPSLGGFHLDIPTFIGNFFFLQTILVPVLGDNGPLWSLANEFWYYIVFPLLFWGASKNSQYLFISRFFMVILAVTILALLPGILSGFVVWLFGVFVAAMQGRWIYGIAQRASFGLCASLFFLLILILSRSGGVSDIIIGCSFSLMLPWALGLSRYPKLIAAVSAWISDISFTLYLAHFPLASFLWYSFLGSERLAPSAVAFCRFTVILTILVFYSYMLSLIFEKNTDKLRRYITKIIQSNTT